MVKIISIEPIEGRTKVVIESVFKDGGTAEYIFNISSDVFVEKYYAVSKGRHIQKVFTELSDDEREFLISGIPVGDFDNLFKGLDE
jgi:hypothetical protein